jgi:ribose transport system permease protein
MRVWLRLLLATPTKVDWVKDMNWKQLKKSWLKNDLAMTFFVLAGLIVLNAIMQRGFFEYSVIKSNLMTMAPLILMAVAQGVVIMAGGIDLSIGGIVTLVNVIMASMMGDSAGSVLAAVIVAALVGVGASALNGLLVGLLRLPAMVATFGTSAAWFGLSLMIMPQPGGYVPAMFYRMYKDSLFGFIPVALIFIIVAYLIFYFFKRRRMYTHILAAGGNEGSASASGIRVSKIRLQAYMVSGIFIALAGIVLTASTASGDPSLGTGFPLTSIAGAVVGGIAMQGGKGNFAGAVMGACILALITNIIFFANVPSIYQDFIKGLVIVGALILATIPRIRAMRKYAG